MRATICSDMNFEMAKRSWYLHYGSKKQNGIHLKQWGLKTCIFFPTTDSTFSQGHAWIYLIRESYSLDLDFLKIWPCVYSSMISLEAQEGR